ncbi:hypothetical protein [Sporomusa malonica]|uniref:hypothetical protein n=1 Tax=Sporomusa malonica TaxID=112901 RepID=UPI0015938063|nr:hypothetical protein [Sporomusa malonica]
MFNHLLQKDIACERQASSLACCTGDFAHVLIYMLIDMRLGKQLSQMIKNMYGARYVRIR